MDVWYTKITISSVHMMDTIKKAKVVYQASDYESKQAEGRRK